MVFPGKNPSEDREMQHGIRETVQMAPGRVGPVFPQAPMPGPSAPAADHVVLDWLQCIRQSDEGRMT